MTSGVSRDEENVADFLSRFNGELDAMSVPVSTVTQAPSGPKRRSVVVVIYGHPIENAGGSSAVFAWGCQEGFAAPDSHLPVCLCLLASVRSSFCLSHMLE